MLADALGTGERIAEYQHWHAAGFDVAGMVENGYDCLQRSKKRAKVVLSGGRCNRKPFSVANPKGQYGLIMINMSYLFMVLAGGAMTMLRQAQVAQGAHAHVCNTSIKVLQDNNDDVDLCVWVQAIMTNVVLQMEVNDIFIFPLPL